VEDETKRRLANVAVKVWEIARHEATSDAAAELEAQADELEALAVAVRSKAKQ
jgi:hypothetical protein